jgi:hypothetical protein
MPDDKPAKKNNLPVILGIAGCGGLLLLACCGGGGFGIYWGFVRAKTEVTDAAAGGKDKVKDTKDGKSGGESLKGRYMLVPMYKSPDQVAKLMGSKGEKVTTAAIPRLPSKEENDRINKGLRDGHVNLLWEWRDDKANERVIVGFEENRVMFKGFCYVADKQDKMDYLFGAVQKK